jgi:hypothetical protein
MPNTFCNDCAPRDGTLCWRDIFGNVLLLMDCF